MMTPIQEAIAPPNAQHGIYPLIGLPLGYKLWEGLLAYSRHREPRVLVNHRVQSDALEFLHHPAEICSREWRMVYPRDRRSEAHRVIDRLSGSARLERALELLKELERC